MSLAHTDPIYPFLTPGKQADVILVRTGDINITPVGDPYEVLVSFAQPRNVDTVIVDGRILQRSGLSQSIVRRAC